MNELIEKLAEQAEEYAFNEIQKPQDPTKWKSYSQMYDEKFAELIVRECISQIEKQGNGLTSTDWDEGYRSGLNASQKATKRHFGVEE